MVVRKQTYLTVELDRAIKRLARVREVSEAEIIRLAVAAYVEKEKEVGSEDPFEDLIGYIEGGLPSDASVNHDRYLYGDNEND